MSQSPRKPLPTYETERLILRPVTPQDAVSYEKNFATREVIWNLSAKVPWPFPKGGVLEFLRATIFPEQGKSQWLWVITLKENPEEVIGAVQLWREGCPENRGFWLAREHWGKGYMTEAVGPVMDFAFEELAFEKLIFSNAVGNTRSRRIKEKTGARLIGIRPARFVNPEIHQAETWELTREEWGRFKNNY